MSILSTPADAGGQVLDPIAAVIKNPFSTTVNNNGARPNDFPGGFQIIEYVNGAINPATQIRMVGNMMPFQPFEWDGEQRLIKEYYPGNPEAAVQVLGPKEGPLILKGRFKDKRFKDPSYYGVAYQMCLAIDEMRKRGNLLKFGMYGLAGNWFRYGHLERAKFSMKKLCWIDYDIEFFVISEKQPINNYFSAPEKQSPSAVNQNLINSATAFAQNYSSVPKSVPRSIADVMNGLISDVAKDINLVTGFISTVLNTVQSIEASANRALGLIKNARATISKFNRQFDQITHAFSAQGSNKISAPNLARATYNNVGYTTEAMAGTHQMSAYLTKMQSQFEAIARTIPKARYRVQKGDTLQNISVKFYGKSDNWTDIYDHNLLQTTALNPGKVLEIPKL